MATHTEGLLFSNYDHVRFELDNEHLFTGGYHTLRLTFDVAPEVPTTIINLGSDDVDEFIAKLTEYRRRMQ